MTDKYIRIWNNAQNVSRISLEKLGYSTKRNDPGTIGQFGSGVKFAPIAAIRNGIDWFFSGSDSNGDYVLKYIVQNEDGIDCIAYDYGDYVKASSFTLDAGSLSWSDSFQIYREPVANAIDASDGDDTNWGIDIVSADGIKTYPGKFCVFLTATPDLMKIHNDFHKYFLTNRKLVAQSSYNDVQMYEKIDNSFRVYCHGVLVHHDDTIRSLYDYNINTIELNEERNIKSLWDLEFRITSCIASLSTIPIVKNIISAGMRDDADCYFEFSKLTTSLFNSYVDRDSWHIAFHSEYGDNAVIFDRIGSHIGVENHIKAHGSNPVLVDNPILYSLLQSAKVKDYTTTVAEEIEYDIDFNIKNYPALVKAIEIAKHFEPGIEDVENQIGVWISDDISIYGKTLNMTKSVEERIIMISYDHIAGANLADLVATVIHEYDHLCTGLRDGNADGRLFRDFADKRIGRLMVKMFTEKFYTLVDGVLEFPLDRLHLLNGNMTWDIFRIGLTDKVVIRIGGRTLLVNGDIECDIQSGRLTPNKKADSLTIEFLRNVKDVKIIE